MGKKLKSFFDFLIYYFFLLLVFPLRILPLNISRLKGKILGIFCYFLISSRRKITLKNLRLVFPQKSEKEIKKISRRCWMNLGESVAEFLKISTYDLKKVFSIVQIEGRNNLESAFEKNKGIIFVSAHFGNWEVMGMILPLITNNLATIVNPIRNKYIDNFVNLKLRNRFNSVLFPKKDAFKESLKWLKKNGAIGILIDQNFPGGPILNFLGLPSRTTFIVPLLVKKTGAAVFPIFNFPYRNKIKIVIGEEIEFPFSGKNKKELFLNTQHLNNIIGEWIKNNPSGYLWLHDRWRGIIK